jgi:para-aminobenzoate synthetase/4-amino-4-deoxychorismate lyase
MEIIREIESEPRDIYTGAIGYCTPDNDAFFSIPIRTLLIRGQTGDLGVGGGIVWDSTPDGEWAESRLKRAFLDAQAAV